MVSWAPCESQISLRKQYPLPMSSEQIEKITKASKSAKVIKSTKKGAPSQSKSKISQQKFDFLKWLDMYSSGIAIEKLKLSVPELHTEFQNLATELLLARVDTGDKPTNKFKIEKLPNDFVKVLRTKVSNRFYLISLLCNSCTELEVKRLLVGDLAQKAFSKDDLEFLFYRLETIKDLTTKKIVWNEFLSSGILQQESWQQHQLRFLDWGLSRGLQVINPIETLIGLRTASQQFSSLETPQRNKTYRKLLELDILTFIVFLLHISSESFSLKFVEQIIGKKNVGVLLVYFENRQLLVGPWIENFERQFISPILKTTLDQVMCFEDLLPFVVKLTQFSHLVPVDTLPRAVSRSLKREDEYSTLLSDSRVALLTDKLETLSHEKSEILGELTCEKARNLEQEKRIKDFESAIENYENRLRSQMKSDNLGSEAMSQHIKADLLKTLVESLDHLFMGSDGFLLERALQKIGISRLGSPGSEFTWDSELCETLTGEAMENGIVVRSGYTWLNVDKKIVIRRVLLKLK